MNTVTLLQPPHVVFGNGCAPACVDWLKHRNVRHLLVVSSPSVLRQIDSLLKAIEHSGCNVVVSPPVTREPTCTIFERTLTFARSAQIDAVAGIGGGSALDVAKLVAALTRGLQDIQQVFGINLLSGRQLPLLCLPTTSGTGSEVSPNAVFLEEAALLKKAVISPYLVPDAAFIDPLLTLGVPPSVTAATGLDAMTHCIEAYANKFAHPIVDAYAREGIRLISGALLRAVHDGNDLEARTQLALGSYYGGLCLGPVNTAAIHALAYPLGSRFHVPHGVSNAVLLPHVLRFNLSHAAERYAEIAACLGIKRNGSDQNAGQQGVEWLAQLSRACNVPQRLSELNIPREEIPSMAKAAMQVTRLLKNNVRPLAENDAVAIYQASY